MRSFLRIIPASFLSLRLLLICILQINKCAAFAECRNIRRERKSHSCKHDSTFSLFLYTSLCSKLHVYLEAVVASAVASAFVSFSVALSVAFSVAAAVVVGASVVGAEPFLISTFSQITSLTFISKRFN